MATDKRPASSDQEITAINIVYDALKDLEPAAQKRVLEYVASRLHVPSPDDESHPTPAADTKDRTLAPPERPIDTQGTDDSEGISPVAIKWMRRSGLTAQGLSPFFSLGVDEIDLVAKKVPGESKKDRMHSVLLLKGIAAYLSTGVARVTHEQAKEACLHYDAYDSANFAAHLKKSFAAEVAGNKQSGYTLTARGLTNATEIIKALASAT